MQLESKIAMIETECAISCLVGGNYRWGEVSLRKGIVMKKILVTGGTTFVSKYAAQYFVNQGYDVNVLNRNSKPQVDGVTLIEGDRHNLGDALKDMHFDAVVDITAYDACDIADLLNELGSFEQYIMVSSGAVYPDLRDVSISEEASKSFGNSICREMGK